MEFRSFWCICLLGLIGCKTREYSSPNMENYIPEDSSYRHQFTDQNLSSIPTFQSFVQDDILLSLLQQAFEENTDWKVVLARLELAYVDADFRNSASLPSGEIGLKYVEGKQKNRMTDFQEEKIPNWKSNGLLSWELDLWGKWEQVRESNKHEILSANHDTLASKISLIHEIAEVWFELRYLEEDLLLIRESLASYESSYQLYLNRLAVGLEDNASITRQGTEKDRILLEKNQTLRRLDLTKVKLGRLLGSPLSQISSEIPLLTKQEIPSLPTTLPSWVLRNRPDFQAAEFRLVSHFHIEKGTQLDLYPSIGLNLSGGGMSNSLSEPFALWEAKLGPFLNIPFLSPTRKQKIRLEKAHFKILESEWKAMIVRGVEEIQAALIAFTMIKEELMLSNKITEQSGMILEVTRQKLQQGIVSQLQLLEDEKLFLKAGRKTLEIRLEFFKAAFGLSKSLGLSTQ